MADDPMTLRGIALDRAVTELLGLEPDGWMCPEFHKSMTCAWWIVEWVREQPVDTAWAFEDALWKLGGPRATQQANRHMPVAHAWMWATPEDICRAALMVAQPPKGAAHA